jgi:undecaprenyl-diphosphatase
MPEWIRQLDTALFFLLNLNCRNVLLDVAMPFITNRWYLTALPFLIFFLLKEKRDKKLNNALLIFAVTFFSILFSDGLANVIKHLIGRERPCNALENVHLLVGCTKSFSMPSNHAANAFAFATSFLIMTGSRIRHVFLFIALLVAFSRIYVGVHYPSDVIAGAITGSASAISLIYLYLWAKRRSADKPHTTLLFVFLAAISVFRIYYILHGHLDLTPDEAHYWEWSRRLDLSYYSKGPMIAYLIAFGTWLFGDNEFGVRFFAVVFSALSSLFLYRLGKEMYNEKVGASAAIILQIIPVFSIFGILFTIDSPFIFFWILSLYLFFKAVTSYELRVTSQRDTILLQQTCHSSLVTCYWFLLGVSIGLGLLSKYTMAFFYICVFLFLVSSSRHRRLLRTPAPYISALISLAVFSPVIIWNFMNNWVTVRHTASHVGVYEGLQVSLKTFLEFIGSQFGVITPILFVLIVVALFYPPIPPLARGGKGGLASVDGGEKVAARGRVDRNFIFWFSVPILLFFLIKSLQRKVEANWAMTGYITGLIAFSEVYINHWKQQKQYLKRIIVIGAVIPVLLTALGLYSYKLHLPAKIDPSARHRTWEKLGQEVSALYNDMKKRGNAFIFSDNYQVSSELAFYAEGQPVTYCANIGNRRMTQYDLWPGFNNLIHYDAVFVTIKDVGLLFKVQNSFERCERRLLDINEDGRSLRTYIILACYDFKGMKEEGFKRY